MYAIIRTGAATIFHGAVFADMPWTIGLSGKGTPKWDAERAMLVEPHAPYAPLAIVHLAGKGMKEKIWTLETLQGGQVNCRLTREGVAALRAGAHHICASPKV